MYFHRGTISLADGLSCVYSESTTPLPSLATYTQYINLRKNLIVGNSSNAKYFSTRLGFSFI